MAIGWSCAHSENKTISNFSDFYEATRIWRKENNKRIDTSINLFREAEIGDLFWTRDLEGYYWICRAKAAPIAYCDIGALLPVDAYQLQLEVSG